MNLEESAVKIILSEYATSENRKYNATNKARNDTLSIASNSGYKRMKLYTPGKPFYIILFQSILSCLRCVITCGKKDIILIQYPYKPKFDQFLLGFLSIGKRLKGYKLFVVIHDMYAVRVINKEREKALEKEVLLFKNFDKIICHNKRMKELFKQFHLENKCDCLGPFYYLYEGDIIKSDFHDEFRLIVAGNLSKAKCNYLYKLPEMEYVKFNLYGAGLEDDIQNADYKGKYLPEELINHLDGNFGLVWDGDSYEECSGLYGEYLKFNNPHKLSLYLAAGLPVIVWSESALASFVLENQIGISISSILELESLKITEEEYIKMKNNVNYIRKQLVSGENLKKLIS